MQAPEPVQPTMNQPDLEPLEIPCKFGFIPVETYQALVNENNLWSDRTHAMEQIEILATQYIDVDDIELTMN